jgi:hypothetical protein
MRFAIVPQPAMVDLNAVTSGLNGATLSTAAAINDAGQIVAMSCTAPPLCAQAFRLDPAPAAKLTAVSHHVRGHPSRNPK